MIGGLLGSKLCLLAETTLLKLRIDNARWRIKPGGEGALSQAKKFFWQPRTYPYLMY
ncbi:MAG: hypothetical protein Phog2KO_51130 [Phototrophicaceae bacterium]